MWYNTNVSEGLSASNFSGKALRKRWLSYHTTTRRHNDQKLDLNFHRRENFKSRTIISDSISPSNNFWIPFFSILSILYKTQT
jgi:hypothetical protein